MEGLIYPGTVIKAFVHATITPCNNPMRYAKINSRFLGNA